MALNLNNPVTEDLKIEYLTSRNDDCVAARIGYEVIVGNDKFALLPLSSDQEAKIGEEVSIDSMGPMRRGKVVRVLSGYQHDYVDRQLVGEDESGYQILERHFRENEGVSEHTFQSEKEFS